MLTKRDVRAAIGWTGLILVLPLGGAILYLLLGVNRIQRRASTLGVPRPPGRDTGPEAWRVLRESCVDGEAEHLLGLARFVDRSVSGALAAGNAIRCYGTGRDAYAAMLAAIENADRSIALATYIFGNDEAGRPFRDALRQAVRRGVAVRVLVDAVGDRYSWPSMVRALRRAGIPARRFLPTRWPWRMPYANLRNHRKLLVVDGRTAFTGGMNIRAGHLADRAGDPTKAIQDLHFRVEGPVVASLLEVFAHDWTFATAEILQGPAWYPPLEARGSVVARAVADGPDEDFLALHWTLRGALAHARERVRIVSPYFLPDAGLISALAVAARRGVDVEILIPERNNLKLVQWASTAQLWQVIEAGCRVCLTSPPFDHTKLMVVDGTWTLLGSANWDPRSLRLNFELDVECYDPVLGAHLEEVIATKRARAREVSLADVDGRRLPIRLRDSITRLFAPYL